ncbi:MAG: hypothetical protein ACK587_14450 [Cyanobacteriota bacterium]
MILGEGVVGRFEAGLAHRLDSGCQPQQIIGVAIGTNGVDLDLRAVAVLRVEAEPLVC